MKHIRILSLLLAAALLLTACNPAAGTEESSEPTGEVTVITDETTAEETPSPETTVEETTIEETTAPTAEGGSIGLEYKIEGDSAVLIGIGNCTGRDIVIAPTFDNMPVVKIGQSAFYDCQFIESVVIPEGVTAIGDKAFKECTALKSIDIPTSVTEIGAEAFNVCIELESVTIRGKVKSLHSSVFSSCSKLKSVKLPAGLESIADNAFDYCTSLKGIDIPSSVTLIGPLAFYGCTALEEIVIPDGVTSIGDEAFYNCRNLKKVTLPSTLEYIQDWAFAYCVSLESIVIPDSVKWIRPRAFSDCSRLSSLTLGKSVEQIREKAFYNCSSLKSVKFPHSLKLVEAGSFSGCTELSSILYSGSADEWRSITKQENWNEGTVFTAVKCSDGEVFAEPMSYDEATELARRYWAPIESGYFVRYASYEMYLLVRPDEVIVDRICIDRYTGEISVPKLTYPDIPDSLLKVLLNETTYIRQFGFEPEGYFKDTVLDYPTAETGSFGYAVCDLDGDGKEEIILSSMQFEIVLREFEGKVYGYLFDFRSLLDLKTDGSFNFVSNAGMTSGTARLSFDGTKYVYNELTRTEKADDGSIAYFVDDKKVTKEEFDAREVLLSQEEATYEHLAIYPLRAWFPGG